MSSTPISGQPWNFNAVLECLLIPKTIAADGKLLPGARLLWGVIRQYSCRDGRCILSNEKLAAAVGVGWHQITRYCQQLERAGLLRTIPRPGRTPVRVLLWNARFNAAPARPLPSKAGGVALQGRGVCLPGQSHIRNKGSSEVVQSKKNPSAQSAPKPEAAAPPTKPGAQEWSEEEYIARGRACGFPDHMIRRDIERMRAREANGQATGMKKAGELKPELEAAIRR
jgi:hypothetical protein